MLHLWIQTNTGLQTISKTIGSRKSGNKRLNRSEEKDILASGANSPFPSGKSLREEGISTIGTKSAKKLL